MSQTLSARLREARCKAGLSLEELARELDVTKQSVYKYEKNKLTPNPAALYKLSCALKIRMQDFFTENSAGELEIVSLHGGEEEAMILLSKIGDKVIEEMELLGELERTAEKKIVFTHPLPKRSIKKIEDVEEAAQKLREKWGFGEMPITNVVDLLENKGIAVVYRFANYGFNGFAANYRGRPLIFINTKVEEVTRRRFMALHKLGYLLLGEAVGGELAGRMEEVCNRLAGALLLPAGMLNAVWSGRKKFVMQDFINLKEAYGLSIHAIWLRAVNLNLLSRDTCHKWQEDYDRQIHLGKYPGIEAPKLIPHLALQCIVAGGISAEDALARVGALDSRYERTIKMNLEWDLTL